MCAFELHRVPSFASRMLSIADYFRERQIKEAFEGTLSDVEGHDGDHSEEGTVSAPLALLAGVVRSGNSGLHATDLGFYAV